LDMFGDPETNTKHWRTAKFSDVCNSRLGKMLDEKQQTGKHLRPYMRNFNVRWGKLDLSDIDQMDFDEKDRDVFRLQFGDILICEGGEVGRSAIWKDQLPECYFQKALHRVRPNPKLANSEYILWLMWWMAKSGGLGDFTSQVTIAHLTGEKLKELIIPVPPFADQEKYKIIVKRSEHLSDQQLEAERQAEKVFQSLLQQAFTEYAES
jgi:type I restriction enzyme, S subunit